MLMLLSSSKGHQCQEATGSLAHTAVYHVQSGHMCTPPFAEPQAGGLPRGVPCCQRHRPSQTASKGRHSRQPRTQSWRRGAPGGRWAARASTASAALPGLHAASRARPRSAHAPAGPACPSHLRHACGEGGRCLTAETLLRPAFTRLMELSRHGSIRVFDWQGTACQAVAREAL